MCACVVVIGYVIIPIIIIVITRRNIVCWRLLLSALSRRARRSQLRRLRLCCRRRHRRFVLFVRLICLFVCFASRYVFFLLVCSFVFVVLLSFSIALSRATSLHFLRIISSFAFCTQSFALFLLFLLALVSPLSPLPLPLPLPLLLFVVFLAGCDAKNIFAKDVNCFASIFYSTRLPCVCVCVRKKERKSVCVCQ